MSCSSEYCSLRSHSSQAFSSLYIASPDQITTKTSSSTLGRMGWISTSDRMGAVPLQAREPWCRVWIRWFQTKVFQLFSCFIRFPFSMPEKSGERMGRRRARGEEEGCPCVAAFAPPHYATLLSTLDSQSTVNPHPCPESHKNLEAPVS